MLSKTSKYGVRAILYLAIHSNEKKLRGVKELSLALKISEPMLSKVLQNCTKKGLVDSRKGRNGGFFMNESQKSDHLMHVIKTLEQSKYILDGCLLGQKKCDSCHMCPYREMVHSIRNEFKTIYGTDTILQTAIKLNNNSNTTKFTLQ